MANPAPAGRCRMGDVKIGDVVRKGDGPWTLVTEVTAERGIIRIAGKTPERGWESELVGGALSLVELRT